MAFSLLLRLPIELRQKILIMAISTCGCIDDEACDRWTIGHSIHRPSKNLPPGFPQTSPPALYYRYDAVYPPAFGNSSKHIRFINKQMRTAYSLIVTCTAIASEMTYVVRTYVKHLDRHKHVHKKEMASAQQLHDQLYDIRVIEGMVCYIAQQRLDDINDETEVYLQQRARCDAAFTIILTRQQAIIELRTSKLGMMSDYDGMVEESRLHKILKSRLRAAPFTAAAS
ncbi:MAG: hypothetical protein M1828_000349 [Chrysothrix sp. TS-e1954]|nr:MAG: hypothetical protein M1828_000349 [Chrysothrix sp. TS-e1954]